MCFSDQLGRKFLDGVNRSELIMSNKTGSLVFLEDLNQDTCQKLASDECGITSLVILDALDICCGCLFV